MIFPKKEILYAPMLGTLGGGSLRSFGRGIGGGGLLGSVLDITIEKDSSNDLVLKATSLVGATTVWINNGTTSAGPNGNAQRRILDNQSSATIYFDGRTTNDFNFMNWLNYFAFGESNSTSKGTIYVSMDQTPTDTDEEALWVHSRRGNSQNCQVDHNTSADQGGGYKTNSGTTTPPFDSKNGIFIGIGAGTSGSGATSSGGGGGGGQISYYLHGSTSGSTPTYDANATISSYNIKAAHADNNHKGWSSGTDGYRTGGNSGADVTLSSGVNHSFTAYAGLTGRYSGAQSDNGVSSPVSLKIEAYGGGRSNSGFGPGYWQSSNTTADGRPLNWYFNGVGGGTRTGGTGYGAGGGGQTRQSMYGGYGSGGGGAAGWRIGGNTPQGGTGGYGNVSNGGIGTPGAVFALLVKDYS